VNRRQTKQQQRRILVPAGISILQRIVFDAVRALSHHPSPVSRSSTGPSHFWPRRSLDR